MIFRKPSKLQSLLLTIDMVKSGLLDAHPDFIKTDLSDLINICNGCGSAKAKFDFVPDTNWGLYIGYCCHPHDFGYEVGVTEEDKKKEHMRMLTNHLKIISWHSNWPMKILRSRRANSYYLAVDLKGGDAFYGRDK